jgi:peptidyl-prolyl cis-trans isomerase SurA
MQSLMQRSKWLVVSAVLLLASSAMAQSGTTDPVLMTVDGKPVTSTEFQAIYKKNNKDAPVTKEALDEYLELFINYKLKVREAEMLGMDTISKFRSELEGYRKQLARPYLIDRELNESLMREAYDRMQQEVRASHILAQVQPDASPEDTLSAWKRINSLRDRVLKGEDFATLAKGVGGSDDPSAAKNGGDLGYFTALQMVYPFESAAFNTPVGEVSKPVRTRFGYHIIKVVDKRAARGQMRAAHIMLRSTDQDSQEQQENAEKRIREIHARIKSGEYGFADAAMRFSEDESSNTKAGELPQFSTGKMIEEFEDAAFALRADGDVSEPVRSRYGWHIIRRLEYTPPPSFDGAKAELKTKISRDSRAEITRRAFLEKLRMDYGVVVRTKNLKPVYALVDTSIFKKGTATTDTIVRSKFVEGPVMIGKFRYQRELMGMMKNGRIINVKSREYDDMPHTVDDTLVVRNVMEGWSYDRKRAAKLTKPVFNINERIFTQRDLLDHLEAKQRRERVVPIKDHVDAKLQEFVDESLLAFEDENLEAKYVDFRMLMKEYRDGILLFELTDQKVWGRAVRDTAGLEKFHADHADAFMWETRYEADIYTCANAAVAKKVRALLGRNKRGADLVNAVNTESALDLEVDGGLFTGEQKPFLLNVTQPGLSADIPHDGRVIIVDLKRIVPPAPKSLDETRGAVTAAYQDSLEREWVEELRAKYPVIINKDVLYSIQ